MAYYFRRDNWSFHPEPPGKPVPTVLVLAAMPLLGLAFLMYLPTIGFWLVFKELAKLAGEGLAKLANALHVRI